MTDTSKQGTAETLGYLGEYEIKDDGANDADVRLVIDSGDTLEDTLKPLRGIRRCLGDEAFMEWLDSIGGDDPGVNHSSFEPPEPPASKCSRCNRTFPRSMIDSGVCTECRL